ncbi:MAG: hypothetical protein AAF050_14380 [Cyanobacteria bacterium J06649_5]
MNPISEGHVSGLALFATIYMVCGQVNFTNLSRYSPLSERTYRRHFGEPYGFIGLNQAVIELAVAATDFVVSAIHRARFPIEFIFRGRKAAH